jgi:hypothetical protein
MIGYFICLAVLAPALSVDVFFGLLGKTPWQYEILVVLSTLLQLFATVTSPFRIAFTLAVFLCAVAVESRRIEQAFALVLGAASRIRASGRRSMFAGRCQCRFG